MDHLNFDLLSHQRRFRQRCRQSRRLRATDAQAEMPTARIAHPSITPLKAAGVLSFSEGGTVSENTDS